MALRGYDRDEDLDEYEEDGEQEEEELGEEEYEEEGKEEVHQPTQEELEYLELRQKLKESFRKKLKKESGSGSGNSLEKKSKLPYDNFGSFFGPSQPVIAQRVIQESKSLLENPHLVSRASKSNHAKNKSSAPTPSGSKPRADNRLPNVTNGVKSKAQMLKNVRDYSFLQSDEAELPAPIKDPQPHNASRPNSDARAAQLPPRSKQSSNSHRKIVNGREERRPMNASSLSQPKVGSQKLASSSRPNLTSADSRRQLGSNNANGPGRPAGPRMPPSKTALPSKIPEANREKKVSAPSTSSSMSGRQNIPASKLHSSMPKQPLAQRKEIQESVKTKMATKKPILSSKPQINQSLVKHPARATMQQERPKKKPMRWEPDEDYDDDYTDGDVSSMIRRMFGYRPERYKDIDDDDSGMEANFNDIQREENHSARIAMREDEEELRKIEEEERRERMRKMAKKRKLSQQ